jgi:two-component system LytT family response regulator
VQDRVGHAGIVAEQGARVDQAIVAYESFLRPSALERIPVRRGGEIILVPVASVSSIVAEGELLYLTTVKGERHTITYRLKDLESRLDSSRFIRLGRGTLANIDEIVKVQVMPGGTHVALLANGEQLQISRLQSRILRQRFFRL